MRQDSGKFIQIDGIDGAGKSTLLEAARKWLEDQGFKTFDLMEFSKREKRLPSLDEVADSDALLTAEPTHVWIGAAIRQEIIRQDSPYSARFTAEAFALDRGIEYTRLILPFLLARPNRWVIQDRGVLSSLAYQPVQSKYQNEQPPMDFDWLVNLEGNRIAIQNQPDVFLFLDIDPNLAQRRLSERTDKIDGDKFSSLQFQTALASRFHDPQVTAPLTNRGTQLVVIDGAKTIDEVGREMVNILNKMI